MIRIVILVVALVAGGAAAWMAMAMRSEPVLVAAQQVAAPAPAPTRDVLVMAVDLAPGQRIAKESLRWQAWPEAALNPAFIVKPARPDAAETLVGSVVRNRMLVGEPLMEDKLVPRNAGFLAAMLPAGRRAVAVRITAENTAGGFILPNDRVDVLHTVSPREGRKEHATRTILRNVRVVAIDQSVEERQKDDKTNGTTAAVGKTATLELELAQAELLTTAEAAGTLSLALRSAADSGEPPAMVERIEAPPPPTVVQVVTVLRGGRAPAAKAP